MSQIVYYTYLDNCFSFAPEPVLKNLTGYAKKALPQCPAFTRNFKNTYSIKALIDYDLTLDKGNVSSSVRDQAFFDKNVLVRDTKEGACSLLFSRPLFFSEDSLELEVKQATYHANGFTENANIIEGRYNIGKHFRALEIAFMFRKAKKVSMRAGDVLYYVKLHTEENIKFVPFHYTSEIHNFSESKLLVRQQKPKPLSYWYDIHEKFYRKRLLKLIKESLL